jgi:hypothetical protein
MPALLGVAPVRGLSDRSGLRTAQELRDVDPDVVDMCQEGAAQALGWLSQRVTAGLTLLELPETAPGDGRRRAHRPSAR